ncbi:MAG: hypothetical protein AAFR61_15150 [Bacteroidota bacterium]
MKTYFENTDIERRIWGKTEFAQKIGINRSTLRTYIKNIEGKLAENKGYNKYAKFLFPRQIEILLKELGYS